MPKYKKSARQATRKSSSATARAEVEMTLDQRLRQAAASKLSELLEAEVQKYLGLCVMNITIRTTLKCTETALAKHALALCLRSHSGIHSVNQF